MRLIAKRPRADASSLGTGVLRMLPVKQLKLDYDVHQRVNPMRAADIAKKFDWSAFGVLFVMRRPDGSDYVVDGGLRLLAASMRGDIKRVPCMVYKSRGKRHEASVFMARNGQSRKQQRVTGKEIEE